MKIGVIGLGKLGLPVALAIEGQRHNVTGFDVSESVITELETHRTERRETHVSCMLFTSNIKFESLESMLKTREIIFIAVQTPHEAEYEGVTPIPDERKDFDYTHLKNAVKSVTQAMPEGWRVPLIAVISTVLPGTIRRELLPMIENDDSSQALKLVYNPFFIAMGTVIKDFLNPEFVLLGTDDRDARGMMESFYKTIHDRPLHVTSIENAELIKVLYNTYISTKLAFSSTVLELCSKVKGTDATDITNALSKGTERLISAKYLSPGMGDGGACHPRDNIAMSWLARDRNLSYDFFDSIMKAREKQTEWMADYVRSLHTSSGLPVVLAGISFKEGCDIVTGSPAKLLSYFLAEMGVSHTIIDPHVAGYPIPESLEPSVYFIGARHVTWNRFKFPNGSIVVDPWRCFKQDNEEIKYIPLGRSKR